ncbi:MAG: 1-acyl-sn-glycerol-3-phosphate acyltransferase [Bacteroidaceae bacterium]|nr:1-acyl-sn-glycerol-3-phosphate acyltransferase [Bacteroidaceae bacterium]
MENFDAIRPYNEGEMKQALNDLLNDRQFSRMLKGLLPWLPHGMRNGLLRMACWGINTPLQFQLRFMKPVVRHVLRKCSCGATLQHDGIQPGEERYLFLSNHRDIVLDSAILSLKLYESHFPTTCEIAIGDNLLIYPWIRTLVKMNKAFTVRRSLSRRELLESSRLMSSYIHYAITEKHENVWMAQREGRAKDSSDQTQDSILKMLTLCAEGSPIEYLKTLNIVPTTISYEYDPCDYLKAKEFQLKRDNPSYKKSKQDDLDNMKTGIWGQKGRIHYQTSGTINTWLDELATLPRTELYTEIAQRIDQQIHRGYQLYPGNYVAYDLLHGTDKMATHYTAQEKETFERYIASRIALVDIPNPDEPFLRERLLTMYANPLINKSKALNTPL